VENLLTRNNGEVCAAVVRVRKSESSPLLLCRSIKHLYPLKVSSAKNPTEDHEATTQNKSTDEQAERAVPDPDTGRKRRTAAVAREQRR